MGTSIARVVWWLGALSGTALLASAAASCTSGASSTPPVDEAGADGGVPPAPSDGGSIADAGSLGPAAAVLASVTFARSVRATITAGDKVIALFDTKDFAVVDMRDPRAPVTAGPFVTPGQVLAGDYDELRSLGFLVDATGAVMAVNLASAAGAAIVASTTAPALATGNAADVTRVGDRLYVLAGASVVPVHLTLQGTLPVSLTAESPVALSSAATHLTSGGGALYVGYASGTIEAWRVNPGTGAPTLAGTYAAGGSVGALIGKGSKVIAIVNGVDVRVIDFGVLGAPSVLAALPLLNDAVAARLLGRLLLVALSRGTVVTVDLTSYASPRIVTSTPGGVPAFVAAVGGNVVIGTGASAQVLGVPPFISGSLPALTKGAFPLSGSVPITFSKPIAPASATTANVRLACAGAPVTGALQVAVDRMGISFKPSAPLAPSVTCVLDAGAVLDATGLSVAASGSPTTVSFTTAPAVAPVANNAASKLPHTVDGLFSPPGDGGAAEWSDITPVHGLYSYFYADFDGQYLYTLNDWFHSDDKIEPDCYNQFGFYIGSDSWEIRAYGDQTVTAYLNGQPVSVASAGVQGAAGFGGSPNVATPHTIYELKMPATGGSWGTQLSDPHSSSSCAHLATDTSASGGSLTAAGGSSAGTIALAAPTAPTLSIPAGGATGVSLSPQLAWSAVGGANQLIGYWVELSTSANFTSGSYWGFSWVPSWSVPSGALLGTTQYYWRVTAWNGAGSAASAPSSFTTQAAPAAGSWLVGVGVSGSGTVQSTPAGISCPGTCGAPETAGSTVKLTASPAAGQNFFGWAGACAGSGTTATLVVNANLTCVALFGSPRPPTVLASLLDDPATVAVDGTNVYWTNYAGGVAGNGSVMKVPLAGGVATTLAPSRNGPNQLVVSNGVVYWSDLKAGTVMSVPTTGGAPFQVASGLVSPGGIAVTPTTIFFGDSSAAIWSTPQPGGGAVSQFAVLPAGEGAFSMVMSPSRLYFTNTYSPVNQNAVMSTPLPGGGAATQFTAGTAAYYAAIDANNVYTTTGGAVIAIPLGGGAANTLASGASVNASVGIAVDATNIYWTNFAGGTAGAGTVMKAPLAGGAPVTLASGLTGPWGMAVDGASVYWVNPGVCAANSGCPEPSTTGTLMKTAK